MAVNINDNMMLNNTYLLADTNGQVYDQGEAVWSDFSHPRTEEIIVPVKTKHLVANFDNLTFGDLLVEGNNKFRPKSLSGTLIFKTDPGWDFELSQDTSQLGSYISFKNFVMLLYNTMKKIQHEENIGTVEIDVHKDSNLEYAEYRGYQMYKITSFALRIYQARFIWSLSRRNRKKQS